MGRIHKIGKFYTKIIMKNIGIFIFVGLLFVVFHDHGWFPNQDMYAISQLVYAVIIPTMVAYESGKTIGGTNGGVLAVLAVAGVVLSELQLGLLAAMLIGPLCGILWKYLEKVLERYAASSLQMLVRNLCLGILGGLLAMAGHYIFLPVLEGAAAVIFQGIQVMAEHHMTGALSILIEPAKIFFLNNIMNHTILVPLGMAQIQQSASSVFFLLESNPGPGIGMLLALYMTDRKSRKEYAAALFAHGIGGIHEVYFPFALSNLRLLIPLILGGMAGGYCFEYLGGGLSGIVSPGSIIVILLMAGRNTALPVLVGVAVSAAVSFAGSMAVLGHGRKREMPQESGKNAEKMSVEKENINTKIENIGFVCDAGVGSSAMGAALLRRMLKAEDFTDIQVAAYPSDMVPKNLDLVVCQKDFKALLPKEIREREIITVDNLVSTKEFVEIITFIRDRNR